MPTPVMLIDEARARLGLPPLRGVMTTREAQKIRDLTAQVHDLQRELELSQNMLAACERTNNSLRRRVTDLLADLTAISTMEGRE